MTLPATQIYDLADAQLNFEALEHVGGILKGSMPNPGINRATLLLALGFQTGTSTCTFAASTESASTTVGHSLGVKPSVVVCSPNGGSFAVEFTARWDSAASSTTQLVFRLEAVSALTGAFPFSWFAIV